jgi:hypothetical protein
MVLMLMILAVKVPILTVGELTLLVQSLVILMELVPFLSLVMALTLMLFQGV